MRQKSIYFAVFLLFVVACRQTEDFSQSAVDGIIPQQSPQFLSTSSLLVDGGNTGPSLTNLESALGTEDTSEFTISFWMKMNVENSNIDGFPMASLTPVDQFVVGWDTGASVINFTVKASGVQALVSGSVPEPQIWNHYVFIFKNDLDENSNSVSIHLNGNLLALSKTLGGIFRVGVSRTLQISPQALLPSSNIDEIVMWRRELTTEEVSTLYNNGYPIDHNFYIRDYRAWWRVEGSQSLTSIEDSEGLTAFPLQNGFSIVEDVLPAPPRPISEVEVTPGDSSGSTPFTGGSDGYGGELGDGGQSSDSGFF